MQSCRICLSDSIHKKFSRIRNRADGSVKYGLQIFMFCINIEPITENHALCLKCYRKLITYYKFKLLAVKNNEYFETKMKEEIAEKAIKTEIQDTDVFEVHFEEMKFKNEEMYEDFGIHEPEVNETEGNLRERLNKLNSTSINRLDNSDKTSDEELLSTIKAQNKHSKYLDNVKENEPSPKKRGRPKIFKVPQPKTRTDQMCAQCGKVVRNLRDHMKSHLDISKRKKIACTFCNKEFMTHGARRGHVKIKHLGVKQHCDICNKDIVSLQVHMAVMHRNEDLKFVCNICERRFISNSALKSHVDGHTNTKPYECDQCKKTFRLKLSLVSHIKTVHLKIKTHLCQYCSKSYFAAHKLKLHLRSHTNERPFRCKECGKAFTSSGRLKVHQIIHTQIKNYPCQYCDMAFYTSGARSSHITSHTKERRHECQYCGVKFYRSDHKKRHERTAHLKGVNDTNNTV